MEAHRADATGSGEGHTAARAKARDLATSTWFLGAVVFLLTWGGGLVAARTVSIDDSFHAGLNMAVVQGLGFGTDVAVTYGPLGFLKSYIVFYEWPARLAVLYGLSVHLALSLSLVWALRRNFGVVVSLLVALGAAALMRGDLSAIAIRDDAGIVALASIWAIAALTARPPGFIRPLLVYGGAVFTAIELLAKLNTGIIVLAIVGLAVLAMEGERIRNVASFAGTLIVSVVVLWFASGQGIDAVGPFLSRSLDVVSGYSSGARLDWGNRDYDYVLVPLVLVATAAIAWISSRRLATVARLAALAIFAIVAYTSVKAGLVSHDPFHMATFFGSMLGITIAFPLPERTGRAGRASRPRSRSSGWRSPRRPTSTRSPTRSRTSPTAPTRSSPRSSPASWRTRSPATAPTSSHRTTSTRRPSRCSRATPSTSSPRRPPRHGHTTSTGSPSPSTSPTSPGPPSSTS